MAFLQVVRDDTGGKSIGCVIRYGQRLLGAACLDNRRDRAKRLSEKMRMSAVTPATTVGW